MAWNHGDYDWGWEDWGPDATTMYWAGTAAPPYIRNDPPAVAAHSWSHGGSWSLAHPRHMQPGRHLAAGDVRCQVSTDTTMMTTTTVALWPPTAVASGDARCRPTASSSSASSGGAWSVPAQPWHRPSISFPPAYIHPDHGAGRNGRVAANDFCRADSLQVWNKRLPCK